MNIPAQAYTARTYAPDFLTQFSNVSPTQDIRARRAPFNADRIRIDRCSA